MGLPHDDEGSRGTVRDKEWRRGSLNGGESHLSRNTTLKWCNVCDLGYSDDPNEVCTCAKDETDE